MPTVAAVRTRVKKILRKPLDQIIKWRVTEKDGRISLEYEIDHEAQEAYVVGTCVPRLLDLQAPLRVGWARVGLGELAACYGPGLPFLLYLSGRSRLWALLRGTPVARVRKQEGRS